MGSESLVTTVTLGEGQHRDTHNLQEVFAAGFASSYVAVADVDFPDVSKRCQPFVKAVSIDLIKGSQEQYGRVNQRRVRMVR
jgi:hypothetical protein